MTDDSNKTTVTIRIPIGFKLALEKIAKDETRSMSQQVEHFLKLAITGYAQKYSGDVLDILNGKHPDF